MNYVFESLNICFNGLGSNVLTVSALLEINAQFKYNKHGYLHGNVRARGMCISSLKTKIHTGQGWHICQIIFINVSFVSEYK